MRCILPRIYCTYGFPACAAWPNQWLLLHSFVLHGCPWNMPWPGGRPHNHFLFALTTPGIVFHALHHALRNHQRGKVCPENTAVHVALIFTCANQYFLIMALYAVRYFSLKFEFISLCLTHALTHNRKKVGRERKVTRAGSRGLFSEENSRKAWKSTLFPLWHTS